MVYDQRTSIEQFLNASAAKQPAPGGGSAAALAGALASAMGEMVLNYSVGKKGLEAHAPTLRAALDEFHRARMLMIELMSEDQSAYEALTAARKRPPGDPGRSQAITAAAMTCISVPQTLAASAVAILDLADKVVDNVNHFLLSDLAVCADLAMTTVRTALYNVRVNLPEVSDAEQRRQIELTNGKLLARALELIQGISPRLWQRVTRGN